MRSGKESIQELKGKENRVQLPKPTKVFLVFLSVHRGGQLPLPGDKPQAIRRPPLDRVPWEKDTTKCFEPMKDNGYELTLRENFKKVPDQSLMAGRALLKRKFITRKGTDSDVIECSLAVFTSPKPPFLLASGYALPLPLSHRICARRKDGRTASPCADWSDRAERPRSEDRPDDVRETASRRCA